MVDIDQGTQIGADGQRHPAGTQPTDADDYKRHTTPLVGTAASMAAENLILPAGLVGYTRDTKVTKIGDGETAWNDLPWLRVAEEPVRASATAQQAGITTEVDVTGLSVGFEVGDTPWIVEANIPYALAVTNSIAATLRITDAANTVKSAISMTLVAAAAGSLRCEERITTPGTYTRKARVLRSNGSGTLTVLFDTALLTGYIKAGPEK